MGIFDRMGKIISSNVHALLDAAEDDRKSVEWGLEQLRGHLQQGRRDLVEALGAEKLSRKKAAERAEEVAKWQSRAELALRQGDEALAREALKQKQRVQADALAVQQGADEQGQVAQRMQAELARMEARLKTMELSKSSIVHARQKARGGESGEVLGTRGPGPTAFEAFREIEERVDHQDFEQQAMREVDAALGAGAHAQDVEAKFRQLEAQAAGSPAPGSNAGADVEAELAALKKRVSV